MCISCYTDYRSSPNAGLTPASNSRPALRTPWREQGSSHAFLRAVVFFFHGGAAVAVVPLNFFFFRRGRRPAAAAVGSQGRAPQPVLRVAQHGAKPGGLPGRPTHHGRRASFPARRRACLPLQGHRQVQPSWQRAPTLRLR